MEPNYQIIVDFKGVLVKNQRGNRLNWNWIWTYLLIIQCLSWDSLHKVILSDPSICYNFSHCELVWFSLTPFNMSGTLPLSLWNIDWFIGGIARFKDIYECKEYKNGRGHRNKRKTRNIWTIHMFMSIYKCLSYIYQYKKVSLCFSRNILQEMYLLPYNWIILHNINH